MEEHEAACILNNIEGLGPATLRALHDYFGGFTEALQVDSKALACCPKISRTLAERITAWKNSELWKADLAAAEKAHVRLICLGQKDFPKAFAHADKGPALIYIAGTLEEADFDGTCIVGSRACTLYGKEQAASLATGLASAGHTIISGLARGIDTAAHIGALAAAGGRSIAIIGSGLGKLYPPENRDLANQLTKRGAVLSEYPMLQEASTYSFPQRNRLLVQAASQCILIEAAEKSGAMLTMKLALDSNIPCFALCGRVDWPTFSGNHSLIKSGKAQLITSASDLAPVTKTESVKPLYNLSADELDLLNHFALSEISLDELIGVAARPAHQVVATLMSLVLKGVVREYPGKIFKKAIQEIAV